jgi:hypothetical protein
VKRLDIPAVQFTCVAAKSRECLGPAVSLRVLSFILCCLPALALAGPENTATDAGAPLPEATVTVDVAPDHAKLGEAFVVHVSFTHPADQRFELKTPPGERGDFEVLGTERTRTDEGGQSVTRFTVKQSAFALGALKTPELEFDVSAPQGTATRTVPGVAVTIDSALPKDADAKGENLYDVRPPEEIAVRSWRLVYAALALLAAALLAWALVRWLNRPRVVAPVPERPKAPLHVRTTEALDALAKENLPAQGRPREFYFRLSEIVRGYLGERFAFEALECTTPELLEALRARTTPGLPVDELTAFANHSDFVRYAKLNPAPEECQQALELGYRVVLKTTPTAAPTAPSSAPANAPE